MFNSNVVSFLFGVGFTVFVWALFFKWGALDRVKKEFDKYFKKG